MCSWCEDVLQCKFDVGQGPFCTRIIPESSNCESPLPGAAVGPTIPSRARTNDHNHFRCDPAGNGLHGEAYTSPNVT
jgi:hypothetical protein